MSPDLAGMLGQVVTIALAVLAGELAHRIRSRRR